MVEQIGEGYPSELEKYPLLFERMLTDEWGFGLFMTGGYVLAVESVRTIKRMDDGTLWLDAVMLENDRMTNLEPEFHQNGYPIIYAPCTRKSVSINVSQIVMAFELTDS
jgi:hypothetical protein